jgi:hypothetical protein
MSSGSACTPNCSDNGNSPTWLLLATAGCLQPDSEATEKPNPIDRQGAPLPRSVMNCGSGITGTGISDNSAPVQLIHANPPDKRTSTQRIHDALDKVLGIMVREGPAR